MSIPADSPLVKSGLPDGPAPALLGGSLEADRHSSLPPLGRDPSFWAMSITQLLGVLNDSTFKQIVLLLSMAVVTGASNEPRDQQFFAQGVFALAFVLFSGIAGYWSDRVSKRSIIVGCKIAEIAVMGLACWAFMELPTPQAITRITYVADVRLENTVYLVRGIPWSVLLVLFLLGSHSAVFGPAKYGILPEMVRSRDLPRFNGVIQMTTFLALIFGIWIGGVMMDAFYAQLWKAILLCVLIAVAGTVASLWVRRTPIAQPDAIFRWLAVAIAPETMQLFRNDRPLVLALAVYSVFWFVAALLPMIINWLGISQFYLSYGDTSLLLAISSVGIAAGFILGGLISGARVRFGLVRIGAWGLLICLILMGLPRGWPTQGTARPTISAAKETAAADVQVEKLEASHWPHLVGYRGSQVLLVLMGFFAGMFALPVQVFLQTRPPDALKGRVIGTMNLVNWIAIILSATFYFVADALLAWLGLPKFTIFALAGLTLLPIALFYRPRSAQL